MWPSWVIRAGKSTFVTHLVLCLGTCPGAWKKWLVRLTGWPQQEADRTRQRRPADFAHWLPSKAKKAEPRHLWNLIVDRLKTQNLAFVAKPLLERLERTGKSRNWVHQVVEVMATPGCCAVPEEHVSSDLPGIFM